MSNNHLVSKRTLNHLAKPLWKAYVRWQEHTVKWYVLTTQLSHLASLAKWLSVRFRTRWLWVRVYLQSLIISCYSNSQHQHSFWESAINVGQFLLLFRYVCKVYCYLFSGCSFILCYYYYWEVCFNLTC